MSNEIDRRGFLQSAAVLAAGGLAGCAHGNPDTAAKSEQGGAVKTRKYDISLAGWSLHRTLGEGEGKIPMIEMPRLAREEWDIGAIELVNQMMPSSDKAYLDQLAKAAADHNVKIVLIMIDNQGGVGAEDAAERETAVANHQRWIDIAHDFGCHSIRMNWAGLPHDLMEKNPDQLGHYIQLSTPGLQAICEHGEKKNIDVLIENHGGPSSYPAAMDQLMASVNHPRFGTLPDFGNFPAELDKYASIDSLMKHAKKAVSYKCYDVDPATGLDVKIDQERMLKIVHDQHGYQGYIGIEYEGEGPEMAGISAAARSLREFRKNGRLVGFVS